MIYWIKKIWHWLIRVAIWLWEAKLVWFTLPPFDGAHLFIWYTSVGTGEDRFRYTGLSFELLGIVTVIIGLNGTLKLFERTHLLGKILDRAN